MIKSVINIDKFANEEKYLFSPKSAIYEFTEKNSRVVLINQYSGIWAEHLSSNLHLHNFYEMELVYSGKGKHLLHKYTFDMSKGFFCLRALNTLHTTLQDENDVLCSHKLQLSPDIVPSDIVALINTEGLFYVLLNESEFSDVMLKLERLYEEMQNDKPCKGLMIYSIIYDLLIYLLRKQSNQSCTFSSHSPHIVTVLNYINSNIKNDLSINALSKVIHISPHYLGDIFRDELGFGINSYVLELRLQLAVQLLYQSNMSVTDIANECGFKSPAYFISVFKRKFGISPLKYKKSKLKISNED